MRLRKSPNSRDGSALAQVVFYVALGAVCCFVMPTSATSDYAATHASLWACATAASMALVLFTEPR